MRMDPKDFLHAVDIGKKLLDISPEHIEELHKVGGRCQWCQQCLDTWLLVNIYKKLKGLETKINALEVKDNAVE